MSDCNKFSILESANSAGLNQPNIPQGLNGGISSSNWTTNSRGFIQQTFLGASIRSFNVSAGFGDTASTLSVELVNDEYNVSDRQPIGFGDDIYHNGKYDFFSPPVVGTPVYFKFGKNFATIEEAWIKTFSDLYGGNIPSCGLPTEIWVTPSQVTEGIYVITPFETRESGENIEYKALDYRSIINCSSRGMYHFTFGGILQSYTQSRTTSGNPLYSIQVVDPREILSNTAIILNNYSGSVFNNKNFINVYGFLEYDSKNNFDGYRKDILKKVVNNNGSVTYVGDDMAYGNGSYSDGTVFPPVFPITGEGFSRRCDQGIPWYRVRQALEALFNYNGILPAEYADKGFGGVINFRGYNYVVDFSGLPIDKIPNMYFLNFDQIDLLSLAQELCDVISHDLFVSLLPVINHPGVAYAYNYNQFASPQNIIAGVIRLDAINRSDAPQIGSIKTFLDRLLQNGVEVENQDLGYELSNVTTDKIVAGAQEVEMHFFNTNRDRDNLQLRLKNHGEENSFEYLQTHQWLHETSLQQQVLPFYGFLGKNAVTIPRGFGSYQQIMLDSSNLMAHGVGNYYIATEMELRAALVSYEQWSRFLIQYNETYIEELGNDQVFWQNLAAATPEFQEDGGIFTNLVNREYGVSVPRCVFISDKNWLGEDNYPASPCAPPYGYPLYYKRAEKIGIPEAGIVNLQLAFQECITNVQRLQNEAQKRDELLYVISDLRNKYMEAKNYFLSDGKIDQEEQKQLHAQLQIIDEEIKNLEQAIKSEESVVILNNILINNKNMMINTNRLAKKHKKNAMKVYNFVKSIAEKHLGKTFLVKIPKHCNPRYSPQVSLYGNFSIGNIFEGPFGFKAYPISSQLGEYSLNTKSGINALKNLMRPYTKDPLDPFTSYLTLGNKEDYYDYGALKINFNPITEKWESNYRPEPQGGFFNFSTFDRNLSLSRSSRRSKITKVQSNMLAPLDLTNFESNGRISCYVRYDNSESLDFSSISSDSIVQEIATANGYIPDIMEELENTGNTNQSFDQDIKDLVDSKPKSVAFVKCDVDSELYMPPKFSKTKTDVFGQYIRFQNNVAPIGLIDIEISEAEYNAKYAQKYPGACCVNGKCKLTVSSKPYPAPIFFPTSQVEEKVTINDFNKIYFKNLDAYIIDTSKQNLDSDHVYAIVTIPGRVTPTLDRRYLDAQNLGMNGVKIKHLLTQDVTLMPAGYGFELPPPIKYNEKPIDCTKFTLSQISNAQSLQRDAMRNIGFANPELTIGFSQPSPVYPDIFAIPLLSTERCYGPWVSSSIFNGLDNRVRYSDVGGKVEFIKDENLAPWNYAGYQLMNEAGALQAQFSNSLLLFSERGGFVIPDAPAGISLARSLLIGGPLVTSISIDIGDSIKTTVKMDLYTARFGKLQKQKEEAIANIVRERQRIRDQNNAMIRNGIGKSLSSSNLLAGMNSGKALFIQQQAQLSSQYLSSLERRQTVQDKIVSTVFKNDIAGIDISEQELTNTVYSNTASIQSAQFLEDTMSLIEDETLLDNIYNRSAGVNMSELFLPYSNDAFNPYMASKGYTHTEAMNRRIY